MSSSFRFCPQCAHPLEERALNGTRRRACVAPGCGYVHWDNPTPVVAAIVEYQGKIVLARNVAWPPEWYALITGFLERDEHPREAVMREVKEELNLDAQDATFVGHYEFRRMNQIIIEYMIEKYPDPDESLVLAGEASLDATWPLTSPGVPSIRMLHNHFITFDKNQLRAAKFADMNDPNLTDGGQHSLFQAYMRDVYSDFFSSLDFNILKQTSKGSSKIELTGYPQGLPSWKVKPLAQGVCMGCC